MGCTISVTEGNYDLHSKTFFFPYTFNPCCTISVTEGNYDFNFTLILTPPFSFCCTISVTEGNYDKAAGPRQGKPCVALFPLLKGITTKSCCKSNRQDFAVALFPLLKGITTKEILTCYHFRKLACCTISVTEGNYDHYLLAFTP